MSHSFVTPCALAALAACTIPISHAVGYSEPPPPVAFVGAHVIPMDREGVLRDQTVLIRDGRISTVGPSNEVDIPEGTTRVDARGKFLIPGLIDMHTHLFSDDDLPDELAGDELAVMVANGVTTTRLMIGTPQHLNLREKVARGELLGPTLYVASPQIAGKATGRIFNGRIVKSADEARQAVRDFKELGYDFIKLTTDITPEVYDAVIEAAREAGIRVVGHVDLRVGLKRALEAGQQIEHLDAYAEAVLRDDAPSKVSVSDYGVWRKENWATIDDIDDAKVSEVARATADTGVPCCPTLSFFKLCFAVEQSEDELRARPDFRFFPRWKREPLIRAHRYFWTNPPSEERRQKYLATRYRIVKEIHAAGGKIMAGSDSPELFLLYGYSLHRELACLVEAGLAPHAALGAATRNPAEFLGALDHIGTIEPGKRADLVLLDANPLEDIRNTERRAGVMSAGRWLAGTELSSRLDAIADRFEKAERVEDAAFHGMK